MRCSKCGTEHPGEEQFCADCGTTLIPDTENRSQKAELNLKKEKDRHLEMVQIHVVQGQVEADIIQSFLKSRGIESFTRGLAVHSVHPFIVP